MLSCWSVAARDWGREVGNSHSFHSLVVLLGHQRKAEPLRAGAALPTQGGLSTSTHPTAPLFRSQRRSTALAASRAPCPHGSMLAGAGPVPTGCHPPSAWWQSRLPLPNTTSPLAACRMKTTTTWRPAARAALHRRRSRAPMGRRRTVHPATAAAPRRAWLTPPCDATSARVPHIELFHLFFFFIFFFLVSVKNFTVALKHVALQRCLGPFLCSPSFFQ